MTFSEALDAKLTEDIETRKKLVRMIQLKAILDSNKPLYEELDKLTLAVKEVFGTTSVPVSLSQDETVYMHGGEMKFLHPQQVVSIEDNFSEKNTVFKTAGVKRFEAKVEDFGAYTVRLEKEFKKKNK